MNDDHDGRRRGDRLVVSLAKLLLIVAAWCLAAVLVAATWRLVEWIWA